MLDQPEDALGLFRPPHADPDVDRLIRWLEGRGWTKASQIQSALGATFSERRIRDIANASEGQIISWPGSPGYRITREATPDERDKAINNLRSQADNMTRRALQISRTHRGTKQTSGYGAGS